MYAVSIQNNNHRHIIAAMTAPADLVKDNIVVLHVTVHVEVSPGDLTDGNSSTIILYQDVIHSKTRAKPAT